jgi:CRISPR type III-B/RAMP module RAMP protein Cmr6
MPDHERAWKVIGPLSGRLTVTDEDGQPRFRRPGTRGNDGRTGVERANARLILHRTAVLEVLSDQGTGGERLGDLDDAPVRAWAVDTGLGQRGGGEMWSMLAARRARALESLAAATGATVREATLAPQGAMITGTGAGGIRDVGIELHGTYGVPVIPGSTLKGVAAAYARWAGVPDDAQALIFGCPSTSAGPVTSENADAARAGRQPGRPRSVPGSVLFLDALPGPAGVTVAEHVLTPHARAYHAGRPAADRGERPPPAEYLNPVPIAFLVVDGGTFTAHLVGPEAAVTEAARLLAAAVDDIGVGAKTSAGYGYLDAVPGRDRGTGQGGA